MDTRHKIILERMADLQSGLLRYSSHGRKKAMVVNVLDSSCPSLVQFLLQDRCHEKLVDKPASLSQVTQNGYLYISGTISSTGDREPYVLNMNISKAHWFERAGKDDGTLEEIRFFEDKT
jgi:hypothetical protein